MKLKRKTICHDSAMLHVQGVATYIDDMLEAKNTLHIAPILSPIACGTLHKIDVSQALKMPGVVEWICAADIKGKNDIAPILSGEPVFAEKKLEHHGQFIGAIIAKTFKQAQMAAQKVRLQYSEKKPCLTIAEAQKKAATTLPNQHIKKGNVAKIFQNKKYKIFKGEISMGGQDHFYLEGQVAYAMLEEKGGLNIWSSTQHPSEVQLHVAEVLGLAANDIEVYVRRMGGAFGGKESQATIIAAIAALAAVKTKRPCKCRLRRHADMVATGKRHPFEINWQVAVESKGKNRGKIKALQVKAFSNSGNVADLSGPVMARMLTHIDNCYYIEHADFLGVSCKTNTISNTAFRGFGGPQGMLLIESIIEKISRQLQIAPNKMRAVNYYSKQKNKTPYNMKVENFHIPFMVKQILQKSNYEKRRRAIDKFNASHKTLKKGLAMMPVKFGISFNLPTLNQAGALVHVYQDGSIHLNHGGTEMGQGLFVKVAQVVAQTFGVAIEKIKITPTNTGKVPNTSATAASSGSDLNGMAALVACEKIKARMAKVAADIFKCKIKDIYFANSKVFCGKKSTKKYISFSKLAFQCWFNRVSLSATGFYKTPKIYWDKEKMQGRPYYYFTHGAAVCEVVVDILTGENRCLQVDIVQDCGTSLNEQIDLGQIEGGFVQGMGWLTCEQLWWDCGGKLRTIGPSTYKIPGSRDVPPKFNVEILPNMPNSQPTIFRSKAIGEPPLMLAIGVWLALCDAISSISGGKLPAELAAPATPENILLAINKIRSCISQKKIVK